VTRHLVVYSGPESLKDDNTQGRDRFAFNANVSERDLEDYFYPPFEACISSSRGNSAGAMCSDAAQNGVPSCASELLMTQKPKDWNASSEFFVVSDMGSYYNVFAHHKYSANASDALLTDLKAGLDILYLRGGPKCRDNKSENHPIDCPDTATTTLQSNETHDAFEMATNGTRPDSRFTLADLDVKAGTALRLRFDLGEFDPIAGNPYALPVDASVIDGAAHRAVARETTAASVVLLKNEESLLPLAKGMKVAAIGPYIKVQYTILMHYTPYTILIHYAHALYTIHYTHTLCSCTIHHTPYIKPSLQPSMDAQTSAYVHAYAGQSGVMVDFLDGLTAKLTTPPVFVQGCESNQTSKSDPKGMFAAAKQAAAAADVTVLAVGLTLRVKDEHGVGHETEMRDRLSLQLPRVQLDLIAAVRSVAKKVVLVIVSGSAVPFDEDSADAAVYAMYGGQEAGNGLADVLFGDVVPSGRLPFTVFRSLDQMRPMGDYDMTTTPGRTHLFYNDASVDVHGAPQFWFGYGLSYSTFSYSGLALTSDASNLTSSSSGCAVTATVTVHNTGTIAAREVVQLYLNRPKPPSGVPLAMWSLKGYQRTELLTAGASATLHFELNSHDLSTVQADGSRSVTPGSYVVKVGGGNPRDTRSPAAPVAATIAIKGGSCGH
jgi:beta-glucosidase